MNKRRRRVAGGAGRKGVERNKEGRRERRREERVDQGMGIYSGGRRKERSERRVDRGSGGVGERERRVQKGRIKFLYKPFGRYPEAFRRPVPSHAVIRKYTMTIVN